MNQTMVNTRLILDKIAYSVVKHLEYLDHLDCGLLGGNLGEIIFLYQYSSLCSNYEILADKMIEKLFESLRNNKYMYTYCNGLAGLGVGLKFLEQQQKLQYVNNVMPELDRSIVYCLAWDLQNHNQDFLHGYTGAGFYFLMRYQDNPMVAKRQLLKIINALMGSAIWSVDGCVRWVSITNRSNSNISLSHGMSSINLFLSKVIELNIFPTLNERLLQLLKAAVQYILSQRIDVHKYGSFFPTFCRDNDYIISKSRLAWCYGDLGVCYSLFKVGDVLKDSSIQKLALDMLCYNAENRRDFRDNMVVDAEFCHGTTGVATIYQMLYRCAGEKKFLDAYGYWKDITLAIGRNNEDGLFDTYSVRDQCWERFYSILEGLSGIGLFLLAAITDNWDWTKLVVLD